MFNVVVLLKCPPGVVRIGDRLELFAHRLQPIGDISGPGERPAAPLQVEDLDREFFLAPCFVKGGIALEAEHRRDCTPADHGTVHLEHFSAPQRGRGAFSVHFASPGLNGLPIV